MSTPGKNALRTRRGRLSQIPVLELNRRNFDACWPYVLIAVKHASMIAIDLELSGLGDRRGLSARSVDARYAAICEAARTRAVISLGLAVFREIATSQRRKRIRYRCQVFNIITLCQSPFTIEPDSLRFLAEHQFDFNRFIEHGVPYHMPGGVDGKSDALRTLFDEILASGASLCVHNGLVDLCFLHAHFYAPLPDSLPRFLAHMTDWFSEGTVLCDSKYLAEFEARTPASFLEYLFRKCQRSNAREALCGRAYISVQFDDPTAMMPAIRDGIEWHQCGMGGDEHGDARERATVGEADLCVSFAAYGFCARRQTCTRMHDVDAILDVEESRHCKKTARRKRRYSMMTGTMQDASIAGTATMNGSKVVENGDHEEVVAGWEVTLRASHFDDFSPGFSDALRTREIDVLWIRRRLASVCEDASDVNGKLLRVLEMLKDDPSDESERERKLADVLPASLSPLIRVLVQCDARKKTSTTKTTNAIVKNHSRFSVTGRSCEQCVIAHRHSGCHRAGIDAFMTGFAVAFIERMALLRDRAFNVDHCNRLPLSGKPTPLRIQKCEWTGGEGGGASGACRGCEHEERWPGIARRRKSAVATRKAGENGIG